MGAAITSWSERIILLAMPSGGNAPDGNLLSSTDSVMWAWAYSYDHLNRLMSGTPSAGVYSGQNQQLCLNYDSFGNRTQSDFQTTACKPGTDLPTANYSANNQLSTTAAGVLGYDAAGEMTFDGNNYYAYDAEGRVCAVQTSPYSGGTVAYGYLYDAEGRRVAKGTVTPAPAGQAPSCNPASNGFTLTESYVLGQGGERLTTQGWPSGASGASVWQNTNVYAGGKLIATYDSGGEHFQISDPLGTRRIQANSAGEAELDCQSLPFGDQLNCFSDPNAPNNDQDEDATGILTGIHFTAKERDAESGLDYFGARYYASTMGRFMSPDWSSNPISIPFVRLDNPQTLNRYSYVNNNPLSRFDPYGHLDCPGGATQDVACLVQAGWNALKNLFSGGSGNSSSSSSSSGNTVAPSPDYQPQFRVTTRILPTFRPPDYYNFNAQLGFANPSFQYVPSTKNFFVNGAFAAPKGIGVMATAGWSLSQRPEAYLGGRGVSGCGAYGVAACVGYSPGGGGWAFEVGVGTPTIGGSAGYAVDWNSNWDAYLQDVYQSLPVENPNGAVGIGSGLFYNPCADDFNCQ